MFKCSECGKIYDIKPDYCDDCGNDTFIEEVVKEEKISSSEIKKEIKKEPEIIIKEPETVEQSVRKSKKEIDYLSWSFLGICILISLFIIFFAWNPDEENNATVKKEKNPVNTATNIPTSVNGFWNNELPKVEAKKQTPKPPQIEQIKPQTVQQEQKPPVIIAKAPEIKKTQPVQAKSQTIQKPAQTAQKPVQKQVQTIQKPTQTQTKPQTVQQKSATAQKPSQTAQKPIQKPVQTQTKPTQTTSTQPVWQAIQQPATTQTKPQTVDTSALKKELANYKINLRNTIGKKIDFANVIGDGSCTISFKIASNGKIINRAFAKQSTNTTLNDAVYSAVMATPSYNPPPSGYNSETLYLKISFYNGNFQITLN